LTDKDEAILNPPDTITASTVKGLQTAVNAWVKDKGFTVIRRNGRYKKNGSYT